MDFVRINGVLLHYRVAGRADAPVLALVNSLGTDARLWDAVIAALAGQYRLISYDKRGHGLSDAPAGDYRLDQHVDDLEGLLAHLGVERLALAGVSVGGLIAQGFALRHPAQLAALVLSNTAARLGDAAGWNARIAAVRQAGPAAIADAVMERWFSPGFREQRPDELAGWRTLFCRTDAAGYAATCATLRDTDLRPLVGTITAPTLVVAGREDQSTSPALVETLAAAIPGSRFAIVEGAGHLPAIEQPETLAGLLRDFLTESGHG